MCLTVTEFIRLYRCEEDREATRQYSGHVLKYTMTSPTSTGQEIQYRRPHRLEAG